MQARIPQTQGGMHIQNCIYASQNRELSHKSLKPGENSMPVQLRSWGKLNK